MDVAGKNGLVIRRSACKGRPHPIGGAFSEEIVETRSGTGSLRDKR
jgi:hypothetical protein